MNALDNKQANARKSTYRSVSTMLLAAVAATSFAFGAAPAYAQAAPSDSDTVLQVQKLNIRQLHDQLNLNADQEVQWQAAIDAMRDSHAAERMNADQMRQRTEAMLKQPILDLTALNAAHQKAEQQDAQLPEQSAKAWVKFYSGLNDQQKKTFSDAMRPQFENVAHHAARPYDPRTGL
jgi:periplasmic protein CpxP/Spy